MPPDSLAVGSATDNVATYRTRARETDGDLAEAFLDLYDAAEIRYVFDNLHAPGAVISTRR